MVQTPPPLADFSLDELVEWLAGVCAELPAAGDARVAAAPDARTVRYYQSLGLVDRPAYRGRQARYGRRHALQAAAVKRLQAAGYRLDQVQALLAGATDSELGVLLDGGPGPTGGGEGASVVAEPPPAPWGRGWSARELAPGVIVVVDPAQVVDVEATLRALARALGGVR